MTNTITAFPVWDVAERLTFAGHATAEQRALADSEAVNQRLAAVEDLRVRLAEAEDAGRPTAGMIRRSLARAAASADNAVAHCTNSGLPRTACDTCDHTRQLALLDARV